MMTIEMCIRPVSFIRKAKILVALSVQEREKGQGWLEFIEGLAAR